ncbi:hypothetical protein HY065_01420 [Candidatus Berkelbacteria bacterium]|nr:hypothetical protein [Candidatus Berkelbacteria bacterium]
MIIETLRSYRIGPFSIFDFATAYLGIYLVAPLLSWLFAKIGLKISRVSWLWLTIPIAIVVHLALGIRTPLMKMIFDLSGHYTVKIVVLIMLYMGLRDIKLIKKA